MATHFFTDGKTKNWTYFMLYFLDIYTKKNCELCDPQ